jgi:hypothetical protein
LSDPVIRHSIAGGAGLAHFRSLPQPVRFYRTEGRRMKTWVLTLALVALAFAAGVASSSSVIGFGRLVQGSVNVRCVESDACVGDTVDAFLMHYEEDRGGLTGVFCIGADRLIPEDGYFFLRDVAKGRTCPSANYALEFRNPSTRTLVTVESGAVAKIEQGPLHTIDL